MNHLESSYTGRNALWRYLLMVAAVFLASNTIGALPLLAGLLIRSLSHPGVVSLFSADPGNYGIMNYSLNVTLVIMLFPFIAGLGAFMLMVKPLHSRTFRQIINGTSNIRWNRLFTSMLVWLALSALYFFIYMKIDPGNFTLKNTGSQVIILIIISVTMIPFQAALEEILFRGYFMQGFAFLLGNRWLPLLATSLLFALLHGLNPEVKEYGFISMMPQYLLFGLIFGIVTILDDGAEAAIGAHTANNVFLCVMVTNKSSALQTAAVFEQAAIRPWTELGTLFLVGAAFILILKVLFRWNGFSILFTNVKGKAQSNTVN